MSDVWCLSDVIPSTWLFSALSIVHVFCWLLSFIYYKDHTVYPFPWLYWHVCSQISLSLISFFFFFCGIRVSEEAQSPNKLANLFAHDSLCTFSLVCFFPHKGNDQSFAYLGEFPFRATPEWSFNIVTARLLLACNQILSPTDPKSEKDRSYKNGFKKK